MSHDPTALIARIEVAWATAPYPGDDAIFTPDSYDDEGITEYFRGTTWRGHSVERLRGHCSAVSVFFTPKAYAYWLAAYLRAAVEAPLELSQGLNALVNSVTPERELDVRPRDQAARLASLTPEQLDTAADVMEYLADFFNHPLDEHFSSQLRTAVAQLRSLSKGRAA